MLTTLLVIIVVLLALLLYFFLQVQGLLMSVMKDVEHLRKAVDLGLGKDIHARLDDIAQQELDALLRQHKAEEQANKKAAK